MRQHTDQHGSHIGANRPVLILHESFGADARPDETDALVQVEQVSAALQAIGWPLRSLQTGLNLTDTVSAISAAAPLCVFNLVESLSGDGRLVHIVPAVLRAANIPFTGADSDAMYLSSQKLLAKRWMQANDIPTPAWFATHDECCDEQSSWIVKSVWEHASLGLDDLSVVRDADQARARMELCRARHGGEWFAEKFIDGREFNISLVEQDGEPRILPIAEIRFVDFPKDKPRIVGYAAKWDADAMEYHATPRFFPSLGKQEHERLESLVRKCWRVFGLRGYARVDIRLDSGGVPWVLEVNTNPCLSQDAGLVAAAEQGGLSYDELIRIIVDAAVRRGPVPRQQRPAPHIIDKVKQA